MKRQGDLFGSYPDRPGYVHGSDTSHAAAESFSDEDLSQQKRRILARFGSQPNGLTCDEIEVDLRFRHQTASARIRELVLAGFLIDTGRRRQTRSGRPARVYTASKGG
jgi:predicted ArsR family transcriptional regulator